MSSRIIGEGKCGQTYPNSAVKSPAFLETSTLAVSKGTRTHAHQ